MSILARHGGAAGIAVLLALWPVPNAAQERPRDAADSTRISGTVLDQATGAALPGTAVVIVSPGPPDETVVWRGSTDASGSFVSPPLPAGRYELRAQALGFEPVSRAVDLTAGSRTGLRIELLPEAIQLDSVVVDARQSRLAASGFYERRRLGVGYTFTREEIEARNPMRASDLLRMVPGMQVIPIRSGNSSALRFRGNCQPSLVIDGISLSGNPSIDDVLNVRDIEAVEVHSGSFAPARFGRPSCGTVLAWTREGSANEGRPTSWWKVAIAAGLMALTFIASR